MNDRNEKLLSSLRTLFAEQGYAQYKMSKFEEYDLYAKNKDFLVSDSVITFTDGNGKLLALKPDVTLSIVKNVKDDPAAQQKLYYEENVYRIAKGSRNYKEILQAGLECLGDVDDYCVLEVLDLAKKSLSLIGDTYMLTVSHLGILSEVMDFIGVPAEKKAAALSFIGEKNSHELTALLTSEGIPAEKSAVLTRLMKLSGETRRILPELLTLLRGVTEEKTLDAFRTVAAALAGEPQVRIDFSVVGDIRYYNGFVFKGFVEGIPTGVLSGGQYDLLMKKMGRTSTAIGFAVYLDTVEQFIKTQKEFDVDAVLLYEKGASPAAVRTARQKLPATGSVLTVSKIPEGLRYKKGYKLVGEEIVAL